jgi:uncharacterized delta-60 repeat protein
MRILSALPGAALSLGLLVACGGGGGGGSTPPPPTHGILDNTFGTNGVVTTGINNIDDEINALKVQGDGKIVAAGQSLLGSGVNQFALVRYNTDGSLDTTFGTGGIVTTQIGTGGCIADALVIQTDNKMLAAGYAAIGSVNQFALVRYNTDGSLDTTFGTGGIVTTTISDYGDGISDLGLQSDGKLVAAGYQVIVGGAWQGVLARYNPDGSLDTTFGTGGIVVTNLSDFSLEKRLVIQGDGKLVAAGTIGDYTDYLWKFGLGRYNTDGSLDTTFSSSAIAMGKYDSEAWALALQPDGKVLAAGYANTVCSCDFNTAIQYRSAPSNFVMARYTASGALDTGFGNGGTVVTINGAGIGLTFGHFDDLGIQADGSVVAIGASGSSYVTRQCTLARFTPAGALDTTFGTEGYTVSSLGADMSCIWRLVTQSDGKLVCGGLVESSGVTKFLVTRYIP